MLLASNIAKELKVESVGGYLYWSTGFAVKSSKLNGKEQHSYYSTGFFSGKKGIILNNKRDFKFQLLKKKVKYIYLYFNFSYEFSCGLCW